MPRRFNRSDWERRSRQPGLSQSEWLEIDAFFDRHRRNNNGSKAYLLANETKAARMRSDANFVLSVARGAA